MKTDWDRAITDYLLAPPGTPESAAALERVKEADRKRLETEGNK
jgi:hypothetical protein